MCLVFITCKSKYTCICVYIYIYIYVTSSLTKHYLIPLPFHQWGIKKMAHTSVIVTDHHSPLICIALHILYKTVFLNQEQLSFWGCGFFSLENKWLSKVTQLKNSRMGAKIQICESKTNIFSSSPQMECYFIASLHFPQTHHENSG